MIREYRVSASDPDRVNGSSGRTLLRVKQPYANHNGGHLAFGPDGYLYIGLGDGGSGGDPGNRAQNRNTLLGKLLRIDVNRRTGSLAYGIPSTNPYGGRSGLDQIWASGLRNPWGFSFDRATGDLWIGDVGQSAWEEVDRATAVSGRNAGRALNFGWRAHGGQPLLPAVERLRAHGQDPAADRIRPHREPMLDHRRLRVSRQGLPGPRGRLPVRRLLLGEIWYVDRGASRGVTPTRALETGALITGFGEDEAGELYLTVAGGTLYRITDASRR